MILLLLALQATPAPSAGPELVAPGVINTDGDEYGPTLSPDGRTMFFTLRANRRGQENIMMTTWDAASGRWSAPAVAGFSGGGFDKEPYLSPDGRTLFFASTRPWPGKDTTGTGEKYDIFVVERTGQGWGAARPVSEVSSAAYDNYPAVAANRSLYFSSHRLTRRNDLFVATWAGGRYEEPRPLAALNTAATDADPFIAPDEGFLIFSSDRPGGAGSGDLYVSFNRGGSWTAPASLGPIVNTTDYEYTPWVTSDGRWLYFSRGWGEIWRIEMRLLEPFRR